MAGGRSQGPGPVAEAFDRRPAANLRIKIPGLAGLPQRRGPQAPPAQAAKRKKGSCFTCGKPGHHAYECWSRDQPKGKGKGSQASAGKGFGAFHGPQQPPAPQYTGGVTYVFNVGSAVPTPW